MILYDRSKPVGSPERVQVVPKHWRRGATVDCCPRCGGAYESALHRICAAQLRRAEEAQGWR